MITSLEMIRLANLSINLRIDATVHSHDDLMQIAYIVNAKGTHLTLVNAHQRSMADLAQVSQLLKTHITLDFTATSPGGSL